MLGGKAAYSRCDHPMVSCDASPLLALLATAVLVVEAARRLEHSRCTFCSTCMRHYYDQKRSAATSAAVVAVITASSYHSVPAHAHHTEAWTMKRWTKDSLVCPMRSTRPTACACSL